MENNINKNRIFIGDNYCVMKDKSFADFYKKVNFIYIDPPYNTNNKFSYNDKNDAWSEDISKRLEIAHELLAEDGVIFISIDDNEIANLLSIGYKIFGKENFVGLFITKQAQRSNAKHINVIHEYIVGFAKNKKQLPQFYVKRLEDPNEKDMLESIISKVKKLRKTSEELAYEELKRSINQYVLTTGQTWIKNFSNINDNGDIYFAKDLSTPGKPSRLDIDEINLHLEPLKTRGWSTKEKILELHKNNRLVYKNGRPYSVEYLDEAVNNVSSIIDFYSRQGTNDLKKLGLDGLFDTPKPVEMIKFLIRMSQHSDSLILDFYAGSGSTAQAVYELNDEDNMHHKYILIQLDERINVGSEAYDFLIKSGVKNPAVSDAMLLRLNTYLEKNNKDKDYILEKI